jgi:hypothetical protein
VSEGVMLGTRTVMTGGEEGLSEWVREWDEGMAVSAEGVSEWVSEWVATGAGEWVSSKSEWVVKVSE